MVAARQQRNTTMATIGTFTAADNGYTGSVKTLTLNVKAKFVATEKDNDKAPDYRILAGSIESHRHRCSSKPETHQRPSSPDRHALAPCIRRQNRDQIAIARASPSATHLPRVPSL
jgi:hypothetical protein